MQMIQIPGSDSFPRRNCVDRMTPAETAIFAAQRAVEQAGASDMLTAAGLLLERARMLVADDFEATA